MTLWLLPLGTPLRRQAAEIVSLSMDRDLSAEEWAEVERLRDQADRLDARVHEEQPTRSNDLYAHAVAEQRQKSEGVGTKEMGPLTAP